MCEDTLVYKLFENIPIYPNDISAMDLGKILGVKTQKVTELIISSSIQCLIAEYMRMGKIRYTYPDEKSRIKTLDYLINGGDDEI